MSRVFDVVSIARNHDYQKRFDTASSDSERAEIAAAYFREAPAHEWMLADWIFDAVNEWRLLVFELTLQDVADPKGQRRKQLRKCLERVRDAMFKPQNVRSLRMQLLNRSRRVEEEFDPVLYDIFSGWIEDARKSIAELVAKQQLKAAETIIHQFVKGQAWPTAPPPAGLSKLRSFVEEYPPWSCSKRRQSDHRQALEKLLKNMTPSGEKAVRKGRATATFYSWYSCLSVKTVEEAARHRAKA